jgi:hypothetical protein
MVNKTKKLQWRTYSLLQIKNALCEAVRAGPVQYVSAMAAVALHLRSALGAIMRFSSFSAPLDIFHVPTHFPRSCIDNNKKDNPSNNATDIRTHVIEIRKAH